MDNAKKLLTVKRILKMLSVMCLIFVFCPSFMVSCSEKTIDVSVMTAVKGVSLYGEKVVKPHPIMLICVVIPVISLFFLFMRKFADKKTALIIAASGAVNLIVWAIFHSAAKKAAEENYCDFKTTGWYIINTISLLLIVLLSWLVVIGKLKMDSDLMSVFSSVDKSAADSIVSHRGEIPDSGIIEGKKIVGYCTNCGKAIREGSKFCSLCGTPVSSDEKEVHDNVL